MRVKLGLRGTIPLSVLLTCASVQASRPSANGRPAQQSVTAASPRPSADASGFVKQYCVTCHSQRLHTGDLVLEGLDPLRAPEQAAIWEKVIRKVRMGAMPPIGARQPEPRAAHTFVSELETTLDRAAEAH